MIKYMGSKRRLAKHLLPIILKDREEGQWYVEPFVGGANMIENVDGRRIGADSNEYLIAMFVSLQNGWEPPKRVSENAYRFIRENKTVKPHLTGYIGFQLSYGGKFFGGYRRDSIGKRDYSLEAYRDSINQKQKLTDVKFVHSSYDELSIPPNSIIYCDPPYANTTKYKSDDFDHDKFWQWCRDKHNEGNRVFVSEYSAPDDFECVWQMEITSSLTKDTGSKKGVEKLFIYSGESL